MCYAAPGPRCTSHVKAELDRAVNHVLELENTDATDKDLKTARRAITVKMSEYDATPGGIKDLKKQITQARSSQMDGRAQRALRTRLERGETTHAAALEAYAAAQARKQRFDSIKSQVEARKAEIAAGDHITIGDMYPRDMTRAMLEKEARIQVPGGWGGPHSDYQATEHLKACGTLATTNIEEDHRWSTYDSFSSEERSGICATVTCNCSEVLDAPLVIEDVSTAELIFSMNKIR